MKNFLQDIVTLKKKEVEILKDRLPITHLLGGKGIRRGVSSFGASVSSKGRINLIAEIKMKSPSIKKLFFKKIDAAGISKIYYQGGAKAISILTDKFFFGGDIAYINQVRRSVRLPILRKDFIIDEYQIYESRYYGADAILLIARILTKSQIKSFVHLSKTIGMSSVVEIHNESDLDKAMLCNAEIIGINNRDLDTFKIDINTTFRLVSKIPKELIKISESGIKSREDILRLKDVGVNAVLIGEAFLSAEDILVKMKEMIDNPRFNRGQK